MPTIPISLPDDQEPDLFEPAPGPAPVQYDLFEEKELQQIPPATAQCPATADGWRGSGRRGAS